jgi:perosamine synthetase
MPADPSKDPARLARHGGPPACPAGPPRWPPADEEIRSALERAWRDGDWGRYHGAYCRRLAEALAERHQSPFATLCCSGTFAVELALRGLGIGPKDEVIVAGYDFPGNFRAIEAVGAMPVLVDIAPWNWNLDPERLMTAIRTETKALVVTHLHGGLVPMRAVRQLADERGLAVVEDACQAQGAVVEGRPAGTWGDVGVWSFGGSKLLTAGRGGAIFTRREDVHQRAKVFCDRGNQAFPLSELQAAVLLPQLDVLDERTGTRTRAAQRLHKRLAGTAGVRPLVNRVEEAHPAYYKMGFQYLPEELAGVAREEFTACIRAEGVALDSGFRGFGRRSASRCRRADDLAEVRRASEGTLVLHHPVLLEPDETLDCVALAIRKVAEALATVG